MVNNSKNPVLEESQSVEKSFMQSYFKTGHQEKKRRVKEMTQLSNKFLLFEFVYYKSILL